MVVVVFLWLRPAVPPALGAASESTRTFTGFFRKQSVHRFTAPSIAPRLTRGRNLFFLFSIAPRPLSQEQCGLLRCASSFFPPVCLWSSIPSPASPTCAGRRIFALALPPQPIHCWFLQALLSGHPILSFPEPYWAQRGCCHLCRLPGACCVGRNEGGGGRLLGSGWREGQGTRRGRGALAAPSSGDAGGARRLSRRMKNA